MQSQRTPQSPARPATGYRIRLIPALLVVAAGLPLVAQAASDAIVDCDRLASNLRSLDVPAAELPLDAVDHPDHLPADTAQELGATLDADVLGSDAVAPVLLLTPRVANILREIFEVATTDDADAADTDSAPPVVSRPESKPPVPAGSDAASDSNPYVPRFQRHMYRTDI